jgi:mannose-6-phosphate isomerase-like protein (cupin superfamily)
MNTVNEFLESGILESYVLGITNEEENSMVELMCSKHIEVNEELQRISESLISLSAERAFTPNDTVKPLIMATVDYSERIKNGEVPAHPPILNERSTIGDYAQWIDRSDMYLPEDADNIYIKLIANNPQAISAIVWIKEQTPAETHSVEHEKFLILEGTCDIFVNGEKNSLVPGNYMSIPLYADHVVKVTSSIPCKVLLQRVAV